MRQTDTHLIHFPDCAVTVGQNVTRTFPRHVHESFTIGLVDSGTRTLTVAGITQTIRPGAFFVIAPDLPHTCKLIDCCYCVLTIPDESWRRLRQQIVSMPRMDGPAISDGLRQFFALVEQDHPAQERQRQLIALLAQITPPNNTHADDPTIQPAQDYIKAHYNEALNLDVLARTCCLSPYHFQRIFVKKTGLSPHDYLLNLRIQHSKMLLRQGETLAAVAHDVGFVDQSHFTHSFKRLVGLTPGYFARQMQ